MLFFAAPPPLRRHRGLAIFLVLGLLAPVHAETSPAAGTMPEDYTPGLKQILDAAFKESPTMLSSALLVAVADANRVAGGVAPLLPNISGGAQYGAETETVSGNSAATSRTQGLFYDAIFSQPLFQWGALKNQLETQNAADLLSKKNYAEGYRSLVLTLRRQYLSLIQDKINLRNARYELKLSQDVLALATEKLKNGTIASGDIVTPQMDADEKQLRADRNEQAYIYDRRALAHEVGWKDIADETIPLEIPEPKYAPEIAEDLLAGLLRDGARNTFAAQIQELNVRENDLAYKIAEVRLLPKFSAQAEYQVQNQTNASRASVAQTTLAIESYYVVGTWTIFDGFATRAAKQAARSWKRYYERQLQIVTEGTMDQAQNSRRALDFSWRAMNLANRRWQLADSQLREMSNELKLGTASQDAVDGATDALNQAAYANAYARADFLSSWSDFVSTVGADPAMSRLPPQYVHAIR